MQSRKLILILCGLGVLLAFALGIYVYQKQQREAALLQAQAFSALLSRQDAPTYGPATAKVRIVEFFDPACETCRAFYPLVKKIVDEQGGKVQLVVRYLPLHKGSDVAVRILEAARQQNLFWPVTEATLRAQPMWASHGNPEPEHIWEFLGPTGLDIPRAREDARSPAAQAALDQDIAAAVALKVTKTPGFYVNGRPLTEFGPEQLKALVATEVQRAYGQP